MVDAESNAAAVVVVDEEEPTSEGGTKIMRVWSSPFIYCVTLVFTKLNYRRKLCNSFCAGEMRENALVCERLRADR